VEAISLKMPEELIAAADQHAGALRLSRAQYIRKAIERMNQASSAELRAQRLSVASRKVRGESMRVNAEFARIESDPDA
jgi:hypothetical protein